MTLGKSGFLVRRKIVKQLLRTVASHRLTVVVAPMGYGKTTVAGQFVEREAKAAYSFSVPADVRDADSLWDSFWRELEAQGLKEAPTLRRMGFPGNPLQCRHAVDVLEAMPPAVMILDDFHHCADRSMAAFIETASRVGHGNCRVLLLSRTMPEMNLDDMRGKGIAAVYDQAFLAFSEAEAREYFFLNDVADASVAVDAWKYSEGWAAALWLCLRQSKGAGAIPRQGDIESLLDALVYSTHSRAVRAMLAQLSVLDRFTAAEAEALTLDAGAGKRLARIMNGNAFIARDPVRRSYQFHSIFRTFLRKRLEADAELNTPDLYRRAAECHAARREFMMAYRLLAKAGRDDDSLRLLELLASQGGEITPHCRWKEIHDIVQAIPWRIRQRRPIGYIAYIWLCLCLGNEDFDPRLLDEAERRFRGARNLAPAEKRRVAGEVEYLRGFLAFNDYAVVGKHYLRAHELLAGPSFLSRVRTSWSLSSPYVTFICHNRSGRFHEAKDVLAKHWRKMDTLTGGASGGCHLVTAAEYHVERCELDAAERLLDEIGRRYAKPENLASFLLASFSRARLLIARGKTAEAAAILRGSASMVEDTDMFEQVQCHDLALGYVLATLGRTDGLPRWLADGNVYDPPYATAHLMGFILTVYGKILLARGDYKGLENLVAASPDGFGPFEMPLALIHSRIFAAIVAKRKRDAGKALQSLRDALDISRPDGIVLAYVEYGDKILSLLHRLNREAPDDPHLEKILFWCKRRGRLPEGGKKYRLGLLSPRENAVMRLAARGKTTPAIAHGLGISAATVKSVLAHAYAKLDARNRVEAIGRFRALSARGADDAAPIGSPSAGAEKRKALTAREREIMRMVKQGMTNPKIAAALGISRNTAKCILSSVYSKLHVSNRVQAVREFSKRHGRRDARPRPPSPNTPRARRSRA